MTSSSRILSRRDLDFMLYEWLDVERLTRAPRYAEHSREVFDSVLDLFEEIAEEHFAPINRLLDENEPTFDGVEVSQPAEAKAALEVFARSGLASSGMDAEIGGGQLPHVVQRAGFAWLQAANCSLAAYPMLSIANASALAAHGTPEQVARFVVPQAEGRRLKPLMHVHLAGESRFGRILSKPQIPRPPPVCADPKTRKKIDKKMKKN